jgi:hypothetical protein
MLGSTLSRICRADGFTLDASIASEKVTVNDDLRVVTVPEAAGFVAVTEGELSKSTTKLKTKAPPTVPLPVGNVPENSPSRALPAWSVGPLRVTV